MKTAFARHEKGGMVWIKDAGILSAFGIGLLKKKKAGREAFLSFAATFVAASALMEKSCIHSVG